MTEQQTDQQPQYGPPPNQQYQQYQQHPYGRPKRLTRTRDDQKVAGVCGGLARYLDVDPTLVRVAAVVALVLAFPATAVAYVVSWAIMPQA